MQIIITIQKEERADKAQIYLHFTSPIFGGIIGKLYKRRRMFALAKHIPPNQTPTDGKHLSSKTMVIDFNYSFKDYDSILNFYGIWDYECPNPACGAKNHPMRRHATYGRSLILWDLETCALREERMTVLRLKCCSCGTTHAVLTGDMIPFFIYSIQAFLALVCLCLEPVGSVLKTEEKTDVSYQLLYRFLRIFHEYAKRLALLLRLLGMWDEASQPLNSQLIPLLKAQPPPFPGSRFFVRFRIPLFLNRHSTISYPLLFGAALP